MCAAIDAAEAARQRQRVLAVVALAQQQHDVACLAGLEIDSNLKRGARVEAGAEALRQRLTRQGRRPPQRAVPPQELEPVAGRRCGPHARVRERHASREVGVVGIARQHRRRSRGPAR